MTKILASQTKPGMFIVYVYPASAGCAETRCPRLVDRVQIVGECLRIDGHYLGARLPTFYCDSDTQVEFHPNLSKGTRMH